MAITTLNDIINPQVMGDMLEAKIPAMLKYAKFAKVDTTLQGVAGDTKTVPSWNFVGAAEDVAEGVAITPDKMTASTTTFTIKKAMKSISITQEAVNSGLGDPIGQSEKQLAKAIAVKLDNDVLDASLKATLTYNGTSAKIGYNAIVEAIDVFDEEELTEKVLFVAPTQVTTLRKDANFISADKYNNNVVMTGEIGMIAGTRIVPSKKVPLVKGVLDAAGSTTISSANIATYQGYVFDETNKAMVEIKTGDKITLAANPYFLNSLVKLEASSADTEYTEDELAAITIFLKKDTSVDAEWLPKSQQHDVTAAKYYGVALTNASKVVLAKIQK